MGVSHIVNFFDASPKKPFEFLTSELSILDGNFGRGFVQLTHDTE